MMGILNLGAQAVHGYGQGVIIDKITVQIP